MVAFSVAANYPYLVTKRQFQAYFGHTLVTLWSHCLDVLNRKAGGGRSRISRLLVCIDTSIPSKKLNFKNQKRRCGGNSQIGKIGTHPFRSRCGID